MIEDVGRAVHGREIVNHVVIGLLPEKDSQGFRAVQPARIAQFLRDIGKGFFPGGRPEMPLPARTCAFHGREQPVRMHAQGFGETGFGTQAAAVHG